MNNKQLKELPVLSIEDGARLGTLTRTYVDGPKQQIAGFAFTESGGFLRVESEPKLDVGDVHTVGPDALILDSRDAALGANVNERFAELLVLEDIASLPVMSESGISIGRIASVDFDNHSFELTEIDVSPGYFKANQSIPITQVITIGPDFVIVDDAVCREEDQPAMAAAPAAPEAIEGSAI